jgi:hypothetical protein
MLTNLFTEHSNNFSVKFLSFFNLELKKKNFNYFPIEANNFERKIIRKSLNYSMTNNLRMFTLIKAFKYIKYK